MSVERFALSRGRQPRWFGVLLNFSQATWLARFCFAEGFALELEQEYARFFEPAIRMLDNSRHPIRLRSPQLFISTMHAINKRDQALDITAVRKRVATGGRVQFE